LHEEKKRHVAAAQAALKNQRAESTTRAQADLDSPTQKKLVDVFQLVRGWDVLPLEEFRWIPLTSRYRS
jgi:hypothetical protein